MPIIPKRRTNSGWFEISCGRKTNLSLYASRLLNTFSPYFAERVIDEPEANFILPASINSKVQSCNTSEYMTRSSKFESLRPVSTALAIEPIPACNGPKFFGRRSSATSFSKNAIKWSAMP